MPRMTDRVHISKDDRSVYHTCRPTPIPAAIYCYFVKHRVHWTSPLLLINVKKLLFYCMVLPAGEFNAMSSQSHVSHCRVLPLGEFTFVIPEPHATLQSAVTWRNQCHDRATLQGVIISSAILKIVFLPYFYVFKPPVATARAAECINVVHLFVCLFVCLSPNCKKGNFLKN